MVAPYTQPSVIMSELSSNEIETNDVNGFRLAEQGPSLGRCSPQGNIGRHYAIPAIGQKESGIVKRIRSLWSAIY